MDAHSIGIVKKEESNLKGEEGSASKNLLVEEEPGEINHAS